MAGDPKIQIDISAKDKASEVIEDVADAADALEKATPEVTVTADTAAAEADLKAAAAAADALAKKDAALVITAKIDQAKGELAKLEAALRAVDDTSVTTGHKIGDELEQGAGKAGGAVHSMAGNVIGDSAAMATGFGPLGEAIGQLTEGALGGEVAMKGMVAAGAGMAAIALTAKAIGDHFETIKENKAFDQGQVDAYADALKEGLTTVKAIEKALTEAGKVAFRLGGDMARFDFGAMDITEGMANAGISVGQFAELVAGSADDLDKWAAANEAAGIAVGPVVLAVNDQKTKMEAAAAQAAIYNTVFGVTAAVNTETERETRRLNAALDAGVDSIDHTTTAAGKAAAGVKGFRVETAKADTAYSSLIGVLDEEEAWANVNAGIDEYNKKTHVSEEETRGQIRAIADYVVETDTIPATKKTEILALLKEGGEGSVAAAEAELDELSKTRDVRLNIILAGSADIIKNLGARGPGGAPAPTSMVSVNLPRGARWTDIQRAVNTGTRRGGRRYGQPVGRR